MVNSSLYNSLFLNKTAVKGFQKGGGNFMKLFNEKKGFLTATFANLIVQLAITYYVMEKTVSSKNLTNIKLFLIFLLQFGLIILLIIFPMPSWLKFILFSLLSYSFGYVLSFIKDKIGEDVIKIALSGTISIFAVMFSIGTFLIVSGVELGIKTSIFLLYSLLSIIIARIVIMFSGGSSFLMKGVTVFSLLIFSIYIVYDTNTILQRNYYGDFITASLDYYLDIINIFMDITSFLNN